MGNVTYCVSSDRSALVVISLELNEVFRTELKLVAGGHVVSPSGFHRRHVVMPDKTHLGIMIPYSKQSSEIAHGLCEEIVHRLTKTPDLLPEYELIIKRHLDQTSHI